jgi:tRNA (guanine37-N1)-methyltransferase
MNFHIITLFPESFDSYINSSIIGRAVLNKNIKIKFYNPRDFVRPTKTQSKKEKPYLRVDNKAYGGGPGMVLEAEPVIKAVEKAQGKQKNKKTRIIWLSPAGKQFDNQAADKFKKQKDIIIICGRYEGIDARVKKIFKAEEISVGPYVLTGGELPAMVIMDTVARRIPGVLGKIESVEENRVASPEVYTRPEILEYKGRKYRVPEVLISGNHKKIEEWKKNKRK